MCHTGNFFAPGAHFLTLLKTHLCKKTVFGFVLLEVVVEMGKNKTKTAPSLYRLHSQAQIHFTHG